MSCVNSNEEAIISISQVSIFSCFIFISILLYEDLILLKNSCKGLAQSTFCNRLFCKNNCQKRPVSFIVTVFISEKLNFRCYLSYFNKLFIQELLLMLWVTCKEILYSLNAKILFLQTLFLLKIKLLQNSRS